MPVGYRLGVKFKLAMVTRAADIDFSRVICDNGTGYLKMGSGGDNFPRFTIPSIVGRPMLRSNQEVNGITLKEMMFGDEANPHRSLLEITYPI